VHAFFAAARAVVCALSSRVGVYGSRERIIATATEPGPVQRALRSGFAPAVARHARRRSSKRVAPRMLCLRHAPNAHRGCNSKLSIQSPSERATHLLLFGAMFDYASSLG
jgi:hypothetical protein